MYTLGSVSEHHAPRIRSRGTGYGWTVGGRSGHRRRRQYFSFFHLFRSIDAFRSHEHHAFAQLAALLAHCWAIKGAHRRRGMFGCDRFCEAAFFFFLFSLLPSLRLLHLPVHLDDNEMIQLICATKHQNLEMEE